MIRAMPGALFFTAGLFLWYVIYNQDSELVFASILSTAILAILSYVAIVGGAVAGRAIGEFLSNKLVRSLIMLTLMVSGIAATDILQVAGEIIGLQL